MLCDCQEGDEIRYVGGDDDNTEEPPTANHNPYCKLVWRVCTAYKKTHNFENYALCVNGT